MIVYVIININHLLVIQTYIYIHFPSIFKQAIITPISKKPSLDPK